MSDLLERAKAHFSGLERRRIEVPEWGEGGKPAVVTFTALTMAERRKIYRASDKGIPPDGATVSLRAVIAKAEGSDGKKLFDEMNEHELMYKVDSEVLSRIANAILYGAGLVSEAGRAADSEDQLDAAKNA